MTINIVNKNLEAMDVTFEYWLTDAKTGEKVFEKTDTIFSFGLDKKDVTVKIPQPEKPGKYTFHIAVKEPEGIIVSGATTQTFQVYAFVEWLFFGEGILLLVVLIAIVVLIAVAWLRHEEYI